jgi:hypothetical protein
MIYLNIHLESFDRKSFENVVRLAQKGPIAISFAPIQIHLMKVHQINYFKDLFRKKDFVLGQQGLTHKCKKCMNYKKEKKVNIGPDHENYCLWFGEVSEKEQEAFMKKGREKLNKLFEREPELYVPPNHLFGKNTIGLAKKLGYKWITDRAIIPLKPYVSRGIIIVPESKLSIKGSKQIYSHDGSEVVNINKKLISFYDIKASKESRNRINENRKLKAIAKIERDLIRGFGVKKVSSQKLAELVYESTFVRSSFL